MGRLTALGTADRHLEAGVVQIRLETWVEENGAYEGIQGAIVVEGLEFVSWLGVYLDVVLRIGELSSPTRP